jgi:hypothetical protein
MELPDDVLAIIRDYSKPRFKYFREYNLVIKRLGKEVKFPQLKEKIEINGDQIVPILMQYTEAFLNTKRLKQKLKDYINLLIQPMDSRAYAEQELYIDHFLSSRKLEDFLYLELYVSFLSLSFFLHL